MSGPCLPSGGRGSYGDISGPVVTTQVTIPKDVSPEKPFGIYCPPKKSANNHHHFIFYVFFNSLSWLGLSSAREARGSSRSDQSRGPRSRSMSHQRAPRTGSSPSQGPRTRSRTLSSSCRTGTQPLRCTAQTAGSGSHTLYSSVYFTIYVQYESLTFMTLNPITKWRQPVGVYYQLTT